MPAYKPSREHFPGVEKLPAPLRGLIEFLAPPDDPTGGLMPMPMVAGVPPSAIGALKTRGAKLVERLKSEGLKDTFLGEVAANPAPPLYGEMLDILSPFRPRQPAPNVSAPQSMIKAVEFAQNRYPRLFGHVADITGVDRSNIPPPGKITHGSQRGMYPLERRRLLREFEGSADLVQPNKFSVLELNPKSWKPPANTVGHELLHAADQLTDPRDMQQKYNFFNSLTGGYDANSMEVRARNMGKALEELIKVGGRKSKPKR